MRESKMMPCGSSVLLEKQLTDVWCVCGAAAAAPPQTTKQQAAHAEALQTTKREKVTMT